MMLEYIIEVVFDFGVRELISTQRFLTDLANRHNSIKYYFHIDPDIINKNKTCVMTVTFSELDIYSMILFMRIIKKTSKIYIDCIYNNENKLYYTSKTYLGLMNSKMSNKIRIDTKKIYDEDDSILVKEIVKLYK